MSLSQQTILIPSSYAFSTLHLLLPVATVELKQTQLILIDLCIPLGCVRLNYLNLLVSDQWPESCF
jgi:hypothetical protein